MGVYKHKEGHNELSCFVLEGGVSHYKFQWLKNGVPIEPNDNNSLVEYVEDMTKPIGLMLKLGKIQVSVSQMFCSAVLLKNPKIWTKNNTLGGGASSGAWLPSNCDRNVGLVCEKSPWWESDL